MKYKIIDEGFVYECSGKKPDHIAVTTRCAVTNSGEVICSYCMQSKIGINDFFPMLSSSHDGGRTWQEPRPIWPDIRGKYSMNPSIGRSPNGDLFLFSSRTPIDKPGEPFWSQEALGMLENDLAWAKSSDDGQTWSKPHVFPVPLPGAAEVTAPICVTRSGRWLVPYSSEATFDTSLKVDRHHVVLMVSDDQGENWHHTSMIRVKGDNSVVGEAWVVELTDGALLGTCWHIRRGEGENYPNPFAMSFDNGCTWRPTQSTSIMGQSTGLAALPEGRVAMVYNQRLHDTVGVWLTIAKPTESEFGVQSNQIVWHANQGTSGTLSGKHEEWTDFAFGEPSVTLLPDGMLLVVFHCLEPSGCGIRFVKVRID